MPLTSLLRQINLLQLLTLLALGLFDPVVLLLEDFRLALWLILEFLLLVDERLIALFARLVLELVKGWRRFLAARSGLPLFASLSLGRGRWRSVCLLIPFSFHDLVRRN